MVEAGAERMCLPASAARTVARIGDDNAFRRVLWGNKEMDRPMSITT